MNKKKIMTLMMAAAFGLPMCAQTVKLNGIGHDRRTDDNDKMESEYLGYVNGKAFFIVDQGLYTMSWDGSSLTTPVKEPAVNKDEIMGNDEKMLWANNFNLMYANSGAVYVNGKLITVMSRDEQSTATDDELFNVRKWDAKTGEMLDSRTYPKSANLESAGMSYNPKDGKVYGLFYLTEAQLASYITEDEEYFTDEDDADSGREGMDAGYAVCSIDLATMKVTPITQGLYYFNFVTFAINSEGRAFALTSGGSNGYTDDNGKIRGADNELAGAQLYEFDLATGLMKTTAREYLDEETGTVETEYVSTYTHGTGYCSQYKRQSACFSKSNPNIMYWNGYYNSGKGINDWGSWSTLSDKDWRTNGKYDTSLYAVDITTGEATRLSNISDRWIFSCMWVDGDDCSDGDDIDITNPDVNPDDGAYITLSTAENGGIWQQVELGKTYSYFFEPAIGWKLHSVTFNNQDVTSQVTGNNMYTTPAITAKNNALFVTFEQEEVPGADDIETANRPASEVKILGMEGGIRVTNAKAGDLVQVYSVDGRLMQSKKMNTSEAEVNLNSKSLYIVKVADKVVKVRL